MICKTDQEIHCFIEKILEALYDPRTERVRLQVIKRLDPPHLKTNEGLKISKFYVQNEIASTKSEPIIPELFQNIDWNKVNIKSNRR